MGFVATSTGNRSHSIVEHGVEALARLSHRGGLDADGKSGDGAGILIQIPRKLLGYDVAVATVFEWDSGTRTVVEEALAAAGMPVRLWREVPVRPETLGERA